LEQKTLDACTTVQAGMPSAITAREEPDQAAGPVQRKMARHILCQ